MFSSVWPNFVNLTYKLEQMVVVLDPLGLRVELGLLTWCLCGVGYNGTPQGLPQALGSQSAES